MSGQRAYHHGDLRAALLEAAERSLQSHGAAQLSLRDLAREVGVSHAAPRRHFPERQDLLDALAAAGFARLGDSIDRSLGGDDFAARTHAAASAFARFAVENAALLELMNAAKHRRSAPVVAEASESAFEPIVELIREGQAAGSLRGGPPEGIGIILYATIIGITTMVNSGAVAADHLDGLIDDAVEQFLRGAAPWIHT